MVIFYLSVGLEAVGPDLPQPLGEVCSLLNHWVKIAAVVDAELTADYAKRVAARRGERQLITVSTPFAMGYTRKSASSTTIDITPNQGSHGASVRTVKPIRLLCGSLRALR